MKNTLLFFLLFFGIQTHSQDFTIESKGDIPTDILYSTRINIIDDYKSSVFSNQKKKEEAEFNEFSDFFIYEMLTSGNISFGDTITNYLNAILYNIQEQSANNDPIKIYLLKSEDANAFMTKKGILMITSGLVAQVTNEAELAFVIAHEVIHFNQNHIDKEFDYSQSKNNSLNGYKNYDRDNTSKFSYSKDLELEADKLAVLDLLSNTDYDLDYAMNIFDVLLYSHLPLDEKVFNPKFISMSNLDFPKDYYLAEDDANEISDFEDFDDSKSSHPNMKTRKDQYLDLLEELGNRKNTEIYVIGKSAFDHIQLLARKQYTMDLMANRHYAMALQNISVLKDLYPEEIEFLDLCLIHSLQVISEYKNWEDWSDVSDYGTSFEGEIQKINHFLNSINALEFNALSTAIAFKFTKEYPENNSFQTYYDRLMRELVYFHEKEISDFKEVLSSAIITADTLTPDEVQKLSKVEKIKYKRTVNSINNNENYIDFVFVEIIKDTLFQNDFKYWTEKLEKKKEEDDFISKKDWIDELTYKVEEKEEKKLGIKDIVIVEPIIYHLDSRKSSYLQIDDTYILRDKYINALDNAISHTDLNATTITYNGISENDTEVFNDISLLQTWFTERLQHRNKDVVLPNKEFVDAFIEKYDTEYVYFPGYISLRVQNKSLNTALGLTLAVFTIPAAPYYYVESVIPKYSSLYFGYVFNIKTGDLYLIDSEECESKGGQDHLSSTIYKTLTQISNPK